MHRRDTCHVAQSPRVRRDVSVAVVTLLVFAALAGAISVVVAFALMRIAAHADDELSRGCADDPAGASPVRPAPQPIPQQDEIQDALLSRGRRFRRARPRVSEEAQRPLIR